MMAQLGARRAAVLGAGIVGLAITGAARAQMPPGAAGVDRCLSMRQEISQLSAEMSAKMAALHGTDQRLAALTAQLRQERVGLHVNDPAAVEHYKMLLEEHDATWKNAVGPVWAAANDAVARYNASVREYNGNCTHAPPGPSESEYPPPPTYAPPPGPSQSEYPPAPPAPGYPPPPGYAPPPAPSSEYPPAPGYAPPAPSSEYPSAPGYAPPPAPSESEYPPAPGYPPPPSPPAPGYPPAPPYPGPK
jgi:hypothetical protein